MAGKQKSLEGAPEDQANRANRIRYLRNALRYSAVKFGEKHGIALSSLRDWESTKSGGKSTGLTASGALKLVTAFQAEGVDCTLEWLIYGKGEDPLLKMKAKQEESAVPALNQEISLLHKLHPNSIDVMVSDEGMEPAFSKGDCVAGIRCFGADVHKLIGSNCIVQIQGGPLLVRKLMAGTQVNRYNLMAINSKGVSEPVMKNVEIFSAARIFWIRKPL